jgi:hypothetical protein
MTNPTKRRRRLALAGAVAIATAAAPPAWAAPNACELLTDAEVARLIARGQPAYSEPQPTTVGGGKGSVCQYERGQVGLWMGPDSDRSLEQFIKSWQQDKQPRQPVSGVGDKAYVFYPKPRNKYSDQGPFLVATVGPHTLTAALFARESQASGLMGEICRGDQSRLSEKEKKDCASVLADPGETPESLQPAVVELAKVLVARLSAGNLGQ